MFVIMIEEGRWIKRKILLFFRRLYILVSGMVRMMFRRAHLVVPGRDAVKALVFIQQVDGLTQKTGENNQARS